MNILVLKEKHGDLYIEWPADLTVQEEICKHIITERLLNKFYKDEDRVDEVIVFADDDDAIGSKLGQI